MRGTGEFGYQGIFGFVAEEGSELQLCLDLVCAVNGPDLKVLGAYLLVF